MKKIYIAGYSQSKFGKLMALTVPEILNKAITEVCATVGCDPSALDVGAVGAACNISLNKQGLLSGLAAMVPGLACKPIETVENACASGGQAVLSTILKLQAGWGDVGFALGYEKMRDNEGKMDGKLVAEALGYYSHPGEREGKVYIFPHLFAEVMRDYMAAYGVTERDLATISAYEYCNGNKNPYAQMQKVQVTLDEAEHIGDRNRYVVDGLPLKTYDCSQITDGYATLILATEEGLAKLGVKKEDAVEIAGYAQATDPLMKANRDVLHPQGAMCAMTKAYKMAGASAS
ncbi:MAG TPA: thiolase family protein, partial [Terriglobales bacterium]